MSTEMSERFMFEDYTFPAHAGQDKEDSLVEDSDLECDASQGQLDGAPEEPSGSEEVNEQPHEPEAPRVSATAPTEPVLERPAPSAGDVDAPRVTSRAANAKAERHHEQRPYGKQTRRRPSSPKARAKAAPADVDGPLDELLRDRAGLIERIERGEDLQKIARTMLVTSLACTAAFGAALGFFRGGAQIAYAAIKLPLVILLTTAVCAPLYTALKASLRQPANIIKDIALLLSSLALASIVTASLTPLLLFAIFQEIDYHQLILTSVALCGFGGACGFLLFTRGIQRQMDRAHRLVYITFMGVMAVVSMQLTWVMRPFFVRPQTDDVPFVRSLEGSFFESVATSVNSARGVYKSTSFNNYDTYHIEEAPLPTRALDRRVPARRAVAPAGAVEAVIDEPADELDEVTTEVIGVGPDEVLTGELREARQDGVGVEEQAEGQEAALDGREEREQ